jgi:hypothetical protein
MLFSKIIITFDKNISVMKKTFLALSLALFLGGCSKEDITPKQCNCGTIVADGIDNGCYWLSIKNECSNNVKQFCFSESVWMNNHVGEHFCVSNVDSW